MEIGGPIILIDVLVFVAFGLLSWISAVIISDAIQKYEQVYVEETSRTLVGMFLFMDAKRLFYLNLMVMLIFILISIFMSKNPATFVMAAAAGFFLPKLWIRILRKRRLSKFEDQLVDTIVMMSSAMRSGMSLLQAIEIVEKEQEPPISQEFGLVLREYKVGVHLEEALENLAERIELNDLNLIVTSVNMVMASGGKVTEMLDTLADVIQKRRKLEGKLKALTSQGKLQALVVTLLPWALGYMMYLMDPPMITRMFTQTLGIIMLGIMMTLQILGFLAIRKITTVEG